MKNQPKQVFLNIGADNQCEDFNDTSQVSWSENRIFDDDIEYINKSEFDELKEDRNTICELLQENIAAYHDYKDKYEDLLEEIDAAQFQTPWIKISPETSF